MSCGPTVDWDHDYGCAAGFGGFDGIEARPLTERTTFATVRSL
jgi:hypothetical protein